MDIYQNQRILKKACRCLDLIRMAELKIECYKESILEEEAKPLTESFLYANLNWHNQQIRRYENLIIYLEKKYNKEITRL